MIHSLSDLRDLWNILVVKRELIDHFRDLGVRVDGPKKSTDFKKGMEWRLGLIFLKMETGGGLQKMRGISLPDERLLASQKEWCIQLFALVFG